jgi:hypothetical protein
MDHLRAHLCTFEGAVALASPVRPVPVHARAFQPWLERDIAGSLQINLAKNDLLGSSLWRSNLVAIGGGADVARIP